jgi:hypothetical protein
MSRSAVLTRPPPPSPNAAVARSRAFVCGLFADEVQRLMSPLSDRTRDSGRIAVRTRYAPFLYRKVTRGLGHNAGNNSFMQHQRLDSYEGRSDTGSEVRHDGSTIGCGLSIRGSPAGAHSEHGLGQPLAPQCAGSVRNVPTSALEVRGRTGDLHRMFARGSYASFAGSSNRLAPRTVRSISTCPPEHECRSLR